MEFGGLKKSLSDGNKTCWIDHSRWAHAVSASATSSCSISSSVMTSSVAANTQKHFTVLEGNYWCVWGEGAEEMTSFKPKSYGNNSSIYSSLTTLFQDYPLNLYTAFIWFKPYIWTLVSYSRVVHWLKISGSLYLNIHLMGSCAWPLFSKNNVCSSFWQFK